MKHPGSNSSRLAGLLDDAAARIEALQRARHEPIAVVGIGCRFPGGVDGPEAYWQLLRDGVDATGDIPAERWDVDACYDPDPQAAATMYVRRGGFLAGVDRFDARFFDISPREAAGMDPQQRLLLEVAWEALEHAGLAADRLAGSSTGVYLGLTASDYGHLLLREGAAALDAYFSTGNALNGAAGRIAHLLGLHGPCMVVDTACSSSLVAVHLACQALRTGDADVALAGGANLILAPDNTIAICRARMLSPDGRCKTFDARADGYARAEGCGVVVLKRASDARACGDRVLALILGSAVNHDGASGGFTVPNPRAQEALIRRALRNAHVEPAQIDYLEAHGTGTPLGDPIEVQAAAAALGAGRDAQRPLLIGSVKTNIGHAESAAGIAGLIKAVLALHHAEIPPHLHCSEPNPHVPWHALPLRIATARQPWPDGPGPRHAGVSSFGASGTNAHVVLREAADPAPAMPEVAAVVAVAGRPPHLLALSARTPAALRALAGRHAEHLAAHPGEAWADICSSANTGRAQLPVRAAIVAASAADALPRLRALAAGGADGAAPGATPNGAPKVAFLFPGQGAPMTGAAGMGRVLYDMQPTFREAIDRCAGIVRDLLPVPLVDAMHGTAPGALADTGVAQPALFALGFALAQTWRAWGVQPAAVVGHSVGEYVAACVAGVFDVDDGLRLLAHRAQLMSRLPAGGAMAAIAAPAEVVEPWVARHAAEVSIAAVNAPRQTVVSGTAGAVAAIVEALAAAGVPSRRLRVSHAFHSPLVEPMLADFAHAAQQVRYRLPRLPVVSNLTGRAAGPEIATPGYWVRHVREPVRFAQGVQALAGLGCDVHVEAGPDRTLLDLVRSCGVGGALGVPSLRGGIDDREAMLEGVAALYERGQAIDWTAVEGGRPRVHVSLPTYPWERERHWRPASTCPMPSSAAVVANTAGDGDAAGPCYTLEWRPSPVAAAAAAAWEAPQALVDALQSRLTEIAQDTVDTPYLDALAQLETISVGFVAEAWRALGWRFGNGMRCRDDRLASTLGVDVRHERLLHHTARMLEDAGLLRRVADGGGTHWENTPAPAPASPVAAFERLCAACPAAEAETALLARCAPRLADVLAGRQDPVALIFPEGDTRAASRLYGESPGVRIMNRTAGEAVARAVRTALDRCPPGRRLRVLEIGAGTGGTTAALLDALPAERTDYVYTDVSPGFLAAARVRFGDRDFIRYQVLDIERDPAGQGFAGEPAFDLVVAANVLHATRDLSVALGHARRLAAPGALLLLIEGTAPIGTIDLIFGLTDGWWRFADPALRRDYPLIGAAAWTALLERTGFGGAAALALPRERWGVLGRQALILARADDAPPMPVSSAAASAHWLVLADRGGLGARLAVRHAARGGVATVLQPGEAIGPAVAALDRTAPLTVLHLWALDEPGMRADAAEPGRLACGSAVELVRALVDAGQPVIRLWFVTRGAAGDVDAGADPQASGAGLAQATLWGLGRVAAAEHPELRAARADLDPAASTDAAADALWTEIEVDEPEDEVRWRHGERQLARLVRVPAGPVQQPLAFRADASYLITGGLGGLGLLTARWMADRGACTLALVGRSAPGVEAERTIAELRATGVRVVVHQADVGCAADVARVLDHAATHLPPLRGVVHAAGVLDDGTLRQLDWPRFARVLAPKAAGAWHLHRLTANLGLDWMVFYSSFTSVLGTPGQATHAAACAWLDALAVHRRASGLPALSVDWGAWAGVGAAARADVQERLGAHGGGALDPARAFGALERLWHGPNAQVAVVEMDWARLAARGLRRPLLAELASAGRPSAQATPAPIDWPARLRGASANRQRALLGDLVRAETARVLGMAGGDAIAPGQGFFELGMDSLTSLELRNRLAAALRCPLPATVAFDHPNAEALAAFMQHILAPESSAGLADLPAVEIDRLIDELAGPTR